MPGWYLASSETELLHVRLSSSLFHVSHLQNFGAFMFNLYLWEVSDFSVAFITQLSSTVKSPLQVFLPAYCLSVDLPLQL